MSIHFLILLIFIFALISSCLNDKVEIAFSNDKSLITAEHLINVEEAFNLHQSKNQDNIFVQVSKPGIYSKQHIEGALNVWRPDYGSDIDVLFGSQKASRTKLDGLLQRLGVSENSVLILYDHKANVDATRLAWVLDYYGFSNYKIVNGGLKYWMENGFPTNSLKVTPPNESSFKLNGAINNNIEATMAEVKSAILDTNSILIDTREPYEFKAEPFILNYKIYKHKKGAFESGCIPSAININWSKLSDLNGDHRIKSYKDLQYDLKQAGVDRDKNIIVYCHSGSRSSHTYYILKNVLNYPNVKNYDGSWIEWSYASQSNENIPLHKYYNQIEVDSIFAVLESKLH